LPSRRSLPLRDRAAAYREEEVTFANGDGTLAGTMTVPPGGLPAVILLTGSGAQNRDEELFRFKPFRVIADPSRGTAWPCCVTTIGASAARRARDRT
jgi:hypothetical protein